LVIVIVPLSLVGLYITSESVSSQEEANGAHLRTVAQAASGTVSQFVDNLVAEIGNIALAPPLIDTVAAADRSCQQMSQVAVHMSLRSRRSP